jgi:hypothetical protein
MKKNSTLFCLLIITFQIFAQNIKLKEFDYFIQNLDKSKFYSNSIAANKFKELFINERIDIKDSAFVVFDKFYDEVQNKLNDLHINDNSEYWILFNKSNNNQKKQIPDVILNYRKDLLENGFDISMSEGNTWIKQDWNFVSKNFYGILSPTMKEYCTFQNTINREETLEDGAFMISPTRLAERIIWLENFINLNPEFILIERCKLYYKSFLYLLLNGSDHSQILDDNENINSKFSDAFNFITLEYSESKSAKLILPIYNFFINKEKTKAHNLINKYHQDGIIIY